MVRLMTAKMYFKFNPAQRCKPARREAGLLGRWQTGFQSGPKESKRLNLQHYKSMKLRAQFEFDDEEKFNFIQR